MVLWVVGGGREGVVCGGGGWWCVCVCGVWWNGEMWIMEIMDRVDLASCKLTSSENRLFFYTEAPQCSVKPSAILATGAPNWVVQPSGRARAMRLMIGFLDVAKA